MRPGDSVASGAVAGGRLRASDADREQVIDALKAAFVRGRLTRDELAARAGQALTSRTYAELAAITAGLTEVRPAKPARHDARKLASKRVAGWAACVIIPPALGAAFLTYYGGFLVLFLLAFLGATLTAAPPGAGARRRW